MTADGTNDDKIKPEGLNDYQVPPMLLLDLVNAEPFLNGITPVEDEPDEVDFDNEDMMPTDDTSILEDKAEDREYDNLFVGWCVRGLYENGWVDGVVIYYNKSLAEYVIHYSDGSREFLKDKDFDDMQRFFCWIWNFEI